MELPTPSQVAAGLATIGMAAQYFGFTMPNATRADANRDANWAARDQLTQCHDERDKLLDRLME